MRASEVVDLIGELEATAPVEQWTINGIRVWPLIRIQLGTDLFTDRESTRSDLSGTSRVWKRGAACLRNWAAFNVANWMDRKEGSANVGEAQALFLSSGVSFTALEGKYYERFCDPIRSYLDSLGIRSLLLTPNDRFLVPRFSPSKFIQPQLDWIQIKHRIFPRNHSGVEYLPGFELICERLKQDAPAVAPELDRVRRHVSLVVEFSRYFESLLDRVRPSICFLVAYYWLVGYGLLLACKRKGIPTVDIQHGAQGIMHRAYGGWTKVPPHGYELLPTYFWCWTQEEVAVLQQWTEATRGAHRPVVGGNLFLNLCRANRLASVQKCDPLVQEKVSVFGVDKQVLVTLQPGLMTEEFVGMLHSAIRATIGSLQWWIRLHPSMLMERAKVKEGFGSFVNVEIDAATDMPLYALLRHMTVHVTHSSSTVLEAHEFGIRSVVCSRYGIEAFLDQEKTGVAIYAEPTGADLLSAVEKQRLFRGSMEQVANRGIEQVEASHRVVQQLVLDATQVNAAGA